MRFSARNWFTTVSNSGNSYGLDHTCAIENSSVGSTVSAQKLRVLSDANARGVLINGAWESLKETNKQGSK